MKTFIISIALIGIIFSQEADLTFPRITLPPITRLPVVKPHTEAKKPAKINKKNRRQKVDAGLKKKKVKKEFEEHVAEVKKSGMRLPAKKGFWWPFIPKRCMRNGLTFRKKATAFGSVKRFGCVGCWPYTGDTWCWRKKPILCIRKRWYARPPYDVPNPASVHDFYNGWSGGIARVTTPVRGCFIFSKMHADFICRIHFGLGWRMASFHDGFYMDSMDGSYLSGGSWSWSSVNQGGWNFWAYSNIGTTKIKKYWTYIRDQPGNCWD